MEHLIANYPINTCENKFMLPIEYLYNKEELSGDIINDLELLNNNNKNIITIITNPYMIMYLTARVYLGMR